MNQTKCKWVDPSPIYVPESLQALFPDYPFLAAGLINRGITSHERANAYLNTNIYKATPAGQLPGLNHACDRILDAIHKQQLIGIWGYFDVDGQTATALLVQTLRVLNAQVIYYLPIRASEGHGIQLEGYKNFLKKGVELIITCDTGISEHEAIDYSNDQGIDCIITDHHAFSEPLPNSFATVNPKLLPDEHPLSYLSGVGTAFMLAGELLERSNKNDVSINLLDLVAMGTVADLASLKGDNRKLVYDGIQQLRINQRIGLQELFKLAEISADQISEQHISFTIAPRLNAIGRLGDANPIVDFLLTGNREYAVEIATELEKINWRRKLDVRQIIQAVEEQLTRDRTILEQPLILLSSKDWEPGVIGIVASHLVERYSKPAILLNLEKDGLARGSARSIEGIDLYQAISKQKDILESFGGHPMAAGVSIKQENISEFQRRMNQSLASLSTEMLKLQELVIDAYISLEIINQDLVSQSERFAPCGEGNPPLIFASRELTCKEKIIIGKTQEHAKVNVASPSGAEHEFLWWQGAANPLPQEKIDLAYTMRSSNYRGKPSIQLEWITSRPALIPTIQLKPKKYFQIHDLRQIKDPSVFLKKKEFRIKTIIWAESYKIPNLKSVDRNGIKRCDQLVLLTIPPSSEIIQATLAKAKPKDVWLFGLMPNEKDLELWLNSLAGLVRFSLSHYGGKIEIYKIAALLAQTEAMVENGLYWLQSHGDIEIISQDIEKFYISKGGSKNTTGQLSIERQLRYLWQEISAFRNYYLRSDPEHLLS